MKDAWRSVAFASISCLSLMVGFWLVEARDYVSRAEVTEMIKTQSPYVADRQLILTGMENLSRTLEENVPTTEKNSFLTLILSAFSAIIT